MAEDSVKHVLDEAMRIGSLQMKIVDKPGGGQWLIIPDDYRPFEIPPLSRPLPRIEQHVAIDDQDSFVSYVNAFKLPSTRVFALASTPGSFKVTALFDYHGAPDKPDHLRHTATYAPAYAEEWGLWNGLPSMRQVAFAEFIEENRDDIRAPSAAMLLDIVSKFKATKKQDYDSVVYQPDGSAMIAWSDKVEGAGKPGVPVPTELQLGIPVFFRGPKYSVPVFLRYRIDGGVLTFTVKVDRARVFEQDAAAKIVATIATATGLEVLYGSPGAK